MPCSETKVKSKRVSQCLASFAHSTQKILTVTVATAVRPRPMEFLEDIGQAFSLYTPERPIEKGLQTPLSAVRLPYDFEQVQNTITTTVVYRPVCLSVMAKQKPLPRAQSQTPWCIQLKLCTRRDHHLPTCLLALTLAFSIANCG